MIKIPSTDVVMECERKVANPKSPILISPLLLLMKILSHLMSRWMMGCGFCEWRYWIPFRISLHQILIILSLGFLIFFKYLKNNKEKVFKRISSSYTISMTLHRRFQWWKRPLLSLYWSKCRWNGLYLDVWGF